MATPKTDQRFRLISRSRPFDLDVQSFLLDCKAKGLRPTTVCYYSTKLRLLQTYCEQHVASDVGSITPHFMRRYMAWVQETHNPGGSLLFFRAASRFFAWLVEDGELETSPMANLKAPRVPQKVLEPASLPDLKKMLATCRKRTFTGDRDKAILLCLLDTGCRASEFLSLNMGDLNVKTGVVLLRETKSQRPRAAFLGAKARRELLRYLRHLPESGPLWVTTGGSRLRYSGLRQIVRRRAKRAGVPVPSLHSFRRAFALLCLRSGADVYSLQKLMGHSDLSVLRRYLRQTQDDLQKAHQEHGPVDRWL